jgi:hypothetical protein
VGFAGTHLFGHVLVRVSLGTPLTAVVPFALLRFGRIISQPAVSIPRLAPPGVCIPVSTSPSIIAILGASAISGSVSSRVLLMVVPSAAVVSAIYGTVSSPIAFTITVSVTIATAPLVRK